MANCERELKYSCWDDCRMQGCPTHTARLEFQSASNSFRFNLDGKEIYLNPTEFQAMVDLTKALNRVDTGVKFNH